MRKGRKGRGITLIKSVEGSRAWGRNRWGNVKKGWRKGRNEGRKKRKENKEWYQERNTKERQSLKDGGKERKKGAWKETHRPLTPVNQNFTTNILKTLHRRCDVICDSQWQRPSGCGHFSVSRDKSLPKHTHVHTHTHVELLRLVISCNSVSGERSLNESHHGEGTSRPPLPLIG